MKELKQEHEIRNVMKEGETVLMFSAGWCPDCTVIEPELPEVEAHFSTMNFYKIDRDLHPDLAGELNIMGIPSFVVYRNGTESGRFVSRDRKTKDEIIRFLQEV
ncbi:thioredoxin domain-containing protein [Alkalicoccus luteus]|uniref:Thioredoxin family protein n=1 Tax=Alkalicoccus luteus TaxID=1237094 RepID=A0A969PPC0_9BACI|nr:thioredoxin family protein [Alkalicoccus luteus]